MNLVFFVARHDDGDEFRPEIPVGRQVARIWMIALKFTRHHAFLEMKQSSCERANSVMQINLPPADDVDVQQSLR